MSSTNGGARAADAAWPSVVQVFAHARGYAVVNREFVEWSPRARLGRSSQVSATMEAVFDVSGDPLVETPADWVGELNPYPDPRFVQHVQHLKVTDAYTDFDVYDRVVSEVGSLEGPLSRGVLQVAAMRDELSRQVASLEHLVGRVLEGVRRVIKVWVSEEVARIDKGEIADPDLDRQRLINDANLTWAQFAQVWPRGCPLYELDPDFAEFAPWRRADVIVAESTERGLNYYHRYLSPLWNNAAALDVQRHAYDACLHALLLGQAPPTRAEMVEVEAKRRTDAKRRRGNPAFLKNKRPATQKALIYKRAIELLEQAPDVYLPSRANAVVSENLKRDLSDETGIPEQTIAEWLRPYLRERIDTYRR